MPVALEEGLSDSVECRFEFSVRNRPPDPPLEEFKTVGGIIDPFHSRMSEMIGVVDGFDLRIDGEPVA